MALAHAVTDERAVRLEVEHVVLADARRDDQQRALVHLLRERRVLEELHHVVLEHHGARRRGEVLPDLERRLVGEGDAALADVGEEVPQAAREVLAAGRSGELHRLRVGRGEVRGRDRLEIPAREEEVFLPRLACQLRGLGELHHVARVEQVRLPQVVEERLLRPLRRLEPPVGGLGADHRLLLAAGVQPPQQLLLRLPVAALDLQQLLLVGLGHRRRRPAQNTTTWRIALPSCRRSKPSLISSSFRRPVSRRSTGQCAPGGRARCSAGGRAPARRCRCSCP